MQMLENNVTAFASMADLANYMTPELCNTSEAKASWFGGLSRTAAIQMAHSGDTSQVAKAEKIMAGLDIHIETVGQQMDFGVAGFAPCVPEYLGGAPESMYCMADTPSPLAPLKIIVDCVCSGDIEANVIQRRGVAILAAVMALSAMRPVSLEVISVTDCASAKRFKPGHNFSAIRVGINSTPLDLGSACFALGHVGFARQLCYGLNQSHYGFQGGWASVNGMCFSNTRSPAVISKVLELLGEVESDTLYIPAIFHGDPLINAPEKWIQAVLEKHGHNQTH